MLYFLVPKPWDGEFCCPEVVVVEAEELLKTEVLKRGIRVKLYGSCSLIYEDCNLGWFSYDTKIGKITHLSHPPFPEQWWRHPFLISSTTINIVWWRWEQIWNSPLWRQYISEKCVSGCSLSNHSLKQSLSSTNIGGTSNDCATNTAREVNKGVERFLGKFLRIYIICFTDWQLTTRNTMERATSYATGCYLYCLLLTGKAKRLLIVD